MQIYYGQITERNLVTLDFDKTLKTATGILFILMACSCAAVMIFISNTNAPIVHFGKPPAKSQNSCSLEIPLHLEKKPISIPFPRLEDSFSISCERPRPDSGDECNRFVMRIKKTNQTKQLSLPARVDLKFDRELQFSNETNAFWADIQKEGSDLLVRFMIERNETQEEIGVFRFVAEEAVPRSSSEFPENSPIRFLAEGKVLGKDLFMKTYKDGVTLQRIEVCNQVIPLQEGDFLVWKEGKWQPNLSLSDVRDLPIAKVAYVDDKNILFDAWGLEGYSRVSVSSLLQIPFKTKSDEFLSSVRVRSEKQISCMLDKQCFVLKVGDWVLREENRWKILRKSDEKEAFLQGKLEGELFVFDRIDLRNGQQNIQGNLVNLARSQIVPIHVLAQGQKKTMPTKEKGKGK
jgi:hypothetical protein